MKSYRTLIVGLVVVLLGTVVAFAPPKEKKDVRPDQGGQRMSRSERARLREGRGLLRRDPNRPGGRRGMRGERRGQRGPGMVGPDAEWRRQMMEERRMGRGRGIPSREQIDQMKKQHKESIGELRSIHELAVQEKAKRTAKRLEKLIAKHEKQFKKRMDQVKQRQARFQQIERQRDRRESGERPGRGERLGRGERPGRGERRARPESRRDKKSGED